MQNKRIVILLTILIPFSSYSMPDVMFKIGLGTVVFVIITLLIVISYVLSKIVTKKEIKK
jgi:threonine/homoserine/homoserine lactone efflux protein